MSDANRVSLAYNIAPESAYGAWPGTPATQAFQFTSESLKADTSTLRSEVIRSDRNSPYIARNDYGASGDIGLEMQWAAYDLLMQWALLSAIWTTGDTAVGSVTTGTASNVITFGTAYDPTADFALYEWIEISDAATVAPNDGKVGRITAISASTITLDCVLLADEGAKTYDLKETDYIKNGVTLNTFDIEKDYEDLLTVFAHYTGCGINTFGFGWESDGLITGTLGLLMKDELSSGTTKAVPTAAIGNPSLNAIDDVQEFYLNGGTTALNHTAFRWDLNNNLRGRKRVGTLGPFELGTGTAEVNGTLTQHFLTSALMDEYLAFNTAELHAKIDAGTGMIIVDLPAVKFSSGQRVAGGRNQDVMAEMAYEAFYDSTVGHTVKIHRLTY